MSQVEAYALAFVQMALDIVAMEVTGCDKAYGAKSCLEMTDCFTSFEELVETTFGANLGYVTNHEIDDWESLCRSPWLKKKILSRLSETYTIG